MHLLLISNYGFDPAFPSRPETLQARALAARGHRVSAIEYFDRRYVGQSRHNDWLPGGIAVHRSSTLGFFAPEALLRLLQAERPDVLHVHHLRNLLSFQNILIARRLGIPTVMTIHGLLHDGDLVVDRERPLEHALRFANLLLTPRDLLRRLARGAHPRRALRNYLIHAPLRFVDSLIALSHFERTLLIQLGAAPERIHVLPNAIDLSGFAAYNGDLVSQATPDTPLILFIGQLVPRKAFDLLARAMPTVVRRYPRSCFVFVSHNRQGEAELRRIVAEGGVTANFELRGWVSEDEKLRLLHRADVVAAPSRYEGFGIPLIEAMAAARPLVTTDVPACNEIVRHGYNGLITPYDDGEALGNAILRLLDDRALAQALGAQGRTDAFAHYGAARLAADLEALYLHLHTRR
jgi:glycosyltransferase involved in cell wall biosynthesis